MTRQPDILDSALIAIFLVSIYLSMEISLGMGPPVPALPAAAASGVLLLRHMDWIEERHLTALLLVLLCYLLSLLCAPDYTFLTERLKGFVQISYSLIIGYGFFIVAIRYDRPQLARIFLALCAIILIGAALENYTGLKAVSDTVRERVYSFGVYASDERDEYLYGMVRPKLFTSEPSYVTFGFSLFLFGWHGLSLSRYKIVISLGMLAVAYFLMRGPTLLLVIPLIALYEVLIAAREHRGGRVVHNPMRLAVMTFVSMALIVAGGAVGATLYAERLQAVLGGADQSFFYREIGPAITAFDTIARYPLTGIGITGEELIGNRIVSIYMSSPSFSPDWTIDTVARILTNYFWSHWIYFGLGWGLAIIAAMSYFLKSLGVPSLAFCWMAWAIFGQSMGAYVAPRTWFVMFLASALAVMNERRLVRTEHGAQSAPARAWAPQHALRQ